MALTLTSPAFRDGGSIPQANTGEGRDISPPLEWTATLAGTTEFALLCEDPDAPQDEPWVHWIVFKIPCDLRMLFEDLPKKADPGSEVGILQGKNSFGKFGWSGPMPPRGHGTHHYRFLLYALRKPIELLAGASKAQFVAAMAGLVVGMARLTGTYERQTPAARAQERARAWNGEPTLNK